MYPQESENYNLSNLAMMTRFPAFCTVIFKEFSNNSSGGVNLTPYSGVIVLGVILTPKRSLRTSFSGVKITQDLE